MTHHTPFYPTWEEANRYRVHGQEVVMGDNGSGRQMYFVQDIPARTTEYAKDSARYAATRTIHAVTIPGHGLFRAYDDDVESILSRYANPRDNGRRAMLSDANEIATPIDFADVSTSALAIILASFTPGSSAL